jgi:hypothetical protein
MLEDDNSENEQESSTPPIILTVWHDAMSAFNTCYTWAEENNVKAKDILTLKRLQEKVLWEAFRNKKQNTIDAFFMYKGSEMKP